MNKFIFIIFLFLFGCTDVQKISNNEAYKMSVDRIVHEIFIAWSLNETIPSQIEREKLDIIFDILKQADDVEITIIPVFGLNVNNKFVHDRVHIIRDKLINFGVGADKIFISLDTSNRHDNKLQKVTVLGVRIIINEFKIKVPKCGMWSESIGNFDTSQIMPNLGCSTVNNFSKMVANPASVIKYRKTEQDTDMSIKAVDAFEAGTTLSNATSSDKSAVNSNGITMTSDKGGISKPLGGIGNSAFNNIGAL